MSQILRQSIAELEARAKQYESAAAQSRQAAKHLRDLLQIEAPATRTSQSTKTPAKKKPTGKISKPVAAKKSKAKRPAKSNGKPTLAMAIRHVLATRQREKSGGVKATQLYEEIQQAGYRFGGTNQKNNMTYLYKTLRQNKADIKHSADGLFSLA
jgi:FtsZ-interacting cell division protein ZipA